MKRLVLIVAVVMMAVGAQAQNCDSIMLPYFRWNTEQMERYLMQAPEKFEYRCQYARNAFYESDTMPTGVILYDIADVQDKFTGETLPANYVVDLNTLSYYRYNFAWFQLVNRDVEETICFQTPGSTHPYLVVRSIMEMREVTDQWFNEYMATRQNSQD